MSPTSALDGSAAHERVRAVIERLARDGTAVAHDGSRHTLFPVAVSPAEGEALRDWVMRERALITIEIGLGYGIAALYLGEALLRGGDPAARHVALDPNQATRFRNLGVQVLSEAGLSDLVEFHPLASEIALPRFLSDGRRFDFAFVDGNHRFDSVFLDLVYLGRLLHPGRIIVLDDYQLPAIVRAVRFFLTNLGWTLEATSPPDRHHQWAVVRTSTAPDPRAFDDYVDF